MTEVCVSCLDSFLPLPRFPVLGLPWNRLHVLVNHFVVSGLPVAQVRADDRGVTGETERKQGFIIETDVDAERPVVDGMAHVKAERGKLRVCATPQDGIPVSQARLWTAGESTQLEGLLILIEPQYRRTPLALANHQESPTSHLAVCQSESTPRNGPTSARDIVQSISL